MKRLDLVWLPGYGSLMVYGPSLYGTKAIGFSWDVVLSHGVEWCMNLFAQEFGFRDSQVERALTRLAEDSRERRFERVTGEILPTKTLSKDDLAEIAATHRKKHGSSQILAGHRISS